MNRPFQCKHFRGIQHDTCLAGVDWREVTGGDPIGIATRMPCLVHNDTTATCEKIEFPTKEEIEQEEREWNKVVDRMVIASPVITAWKRAHPNGGTGTTECPICHGTLHLSMAAYNGHTHGKCETKDCLNWME